MIHKNGNEVNHPKHYNVDPSGVECIEIVRELSFDLGNAVKYIWRAGVKDLHGDELKAEIEDVKKAIWYLEDEIEREVLDYHMIPMTNEWRKKLRAVVRTRELRVRSFFASVLDASSTQLTRNHKQYLGDARRHLVQHLSNLELQR